MKTAPILMSDLRKGDEFVGPNGRTRYRVTRDMGSHPNGFLDVRNLSMTNGEARAATKRGDCEPGCDPRDGFFSYTSPVTVEKVTR